MKETLDVMIDMSKVYNFGMYTLLDLRDYLSFVMPFLANKFNVCLRVLLELLEVYTLRG